LLSYALVMCGDNTYVGQTSSQDIIENVLTALLIEIIRQLYNYRPQLF